MACVWALSHITNSFSDFIQCFALFVLPGRLLSHKSGSVFPRRVWFVELCMVCTDSIEYLVSGLAYKDYVGVEDPVVNEHMYTHGFFFGLSLIFIVTDRSWVPLWSLFLCVSFFLSGSWFGFLFNYEFCCFAFWYFFGGIQNHFLLYSCSLACYHLLPLLLLLSSSEWTLGLCVTIFHVLWLSSYFRLFCFSSFPFFIL